MHVSELSCPSRALMGQMSTHFWTTQDHYDHIKPCMCVALSTSIQGIHHHLKYHSYLDIPPLIWLNAISSPWILSLDLLEQLFAISLSSISEKLLNLHACAKCVCLLRTPRLLSNGGCCFFFLLLPNSLGPGSRLDSHLIPTDASSHFSFIVLYTKVNLPIWHTGHSRHSACVAFRGLGKYFHFF